MNKNKKKLTRKRRRKKVQRKRFNNIEKQGITEKIKVKLKLMIHRYIESFRKNFFRNAIIAGLIFLLLLLINQFSFTWNENLLEYLHSISTERMDFSNLSSQFDKLYELLE